MDPKRHEESIGLEGGSRSGGGGSGGQGGSNGGRGKVDWSRFEHPDAQEAEQMEMDRAEYEKRNEAHRKREEHRKKHRKKNIL